MKILNSDNHMNGITSNAFILGATGFMGSVLLETLLDQNHRVSCLVHQRPVPVSVRDTVKTYRGSILTFPWSQLEGEAMPDVIYHFARIPGKGPASRRIAAWLSRRANQRLLNWLSTLEDPPLLVLVAGTLGYGDHGTRATDESTPLTPISFAREYAIGEQPVVRELSRGRVPVMVMRPAWVYADQSWLKSFFLKPMQQHGMVPLYGTGENLMSLIHVQDVAGLLSHIAGHGESGQTYNLFTPPAVRQRDFVDLLSKLSGLPVQPVDRETLRRRGGRTLVEALTFSLNVSTRHEDLYTGYKPVYPDLKSGLSTILSARELLNADIPLS